MNMDQELDKLKQIKRVEPPPFLFTRIRAGVDALTNSPAPLKWKLAFAGAAVLLIVLNAGIIFRSGTSSASQIEQVANAMQLSGTNELYHE